MIARGVVALNCCIAACIWHVNVAPPPLCCLNNRGKLFTPSYMTKERVANLYPELPKFVELCKAHDPEGKFRNGK